MTTRRRFLAGVAAAAVGTVVRPLGSAGEAYQGPEGAPGWAAAHSSINDVDRWAQLYDGDDMPASERAPLDSEWSVFSTSTSTILTHAVIYDAQVGGNVIDAVDLSRTFTVFPGDAVTVEWR